MNNIFAWISLVSGLYFILFAFVCHTSNFKSGIIFNFLPFIFGVVNIIVALKLFDVIGLNLK